ncbi:hypothetical protein FYK55_19320 [Roseiconus nitratireducens]|uniref:DUF4190 domain-containing protein n=1 Tax=Roseiconus nitratireducens TaxID=2605748 RepID=A0A5M6D0M0_9BACT|nr:hypothetical protein [Roseiconus nitratireducens]KAA5541048.1 hypothetical protein FYK55_19320 [Roseiconus nitratireducens]
MTTETNLPRSLGAVMSAEAGFEPETDDAPLRVSGFISLLLGLISGFSIVALPMIGCAIAAVLFGVFALRRTESRLVPVGTTAARIGIFLAVLFGSWGFARSAFKQYTLGTQAEQFAREFVKVASAGNQAYTSELLKNYINRYDRTMNLEERFAEDLAARDRMMEENERNGLGGEPSHLESVMELVNGYSPDHEWILDRPVHVYYHYGRQLADVVLAADRSKDPYRIRITLELMRHKDRGTHEWHIDNSGPYRKRLVAERVL